MVIESPEKLLARISAEWVGSFELIWQVPVYYSVVHQWNLYGANDLYWDNVNHTILDRNDSLEHMEKRSYKCSNEFIMDSVKFCLLL